MAAAQWRAVSFTKGVDSRDASIFFMMLVGSPPNAHPSFRANETSFFACPYVCRTTQKARARAQRPLNFYIPCFLPRAPHLPPAELRRSCMYKGQSGMWSWLLHRVTGLGILLFLFIHIVDV